MLIGYGQGGVYVGVEKTDADSGGLSATPSHALGSWEFSGRGRLGPGRRSSSGMSRLLSQSYWGCGGRGSLATTSAILHSSDHC